MTFQRWQSVPLILGASWVPASDRCMTNLDMLIADKQHGRWCRYNTENGGPAPEKVTDAIYKNTGKIQHYYIAEKEIEFDINKVGTTSAMVQHRGSNKFGSFQIQVSPSSWAVKLRNESTNIMPAASLSATNRLTTPIADACGSCDIPMDAALHVTLSFSAWDTTQSQPWRCDRSQCAA